MALLPSASGVVDYLKSKGFRPTAGERAPLYDQRRQIYEASGLGTNLGDFRGTPEQNTKLLSYLSDAEKNVGVSLNPQNLQNIVAVSRSQPSRRLPFS